MAFVSIAGTQRSGKSTYLNRALLGQKTGFGVESTTNSCTKGIWIWTGVIPRYSSAEGETVSIIIADTEGLGSLDADPNYVKKLGSLALSISSHFMYNSVGTIGNDAINNLWLTTQNAKELKSNDKTYETFSVPFTWLLRDTMRLEGEKGVKLTENEYLEFVL